MLEEQVRIVQDFERSPTIRHYFFSDKPLWSKQVEILEAIRKHKRVVVKSGNTVGKSFIAADVVMDWLTIHRPSKVVTTAPTWQQVEEILWKEIRNYCFNSKLKIDGDILQTSLKFNDEWFAVGVSTDSPVRLQGRHSEFLLVVIDEASGIDGEIWDMVEALHPAAILAIGNPIDPTTKFAECFQSDMWHKITISCIDAVEWQEKNKRIPGLVTREWCDDMLQMHGANSDWYRVHVLGEFPEQVESALIVREWVDRARKGLDSDGLALDDEDEDKSTRIIGGDLATKHGMNETVLGYRYGHTIPEMKAYLQCTQTFARDQLQALYTKKEAQHLVTDADGLGESMAELLSEVYVPCMEFHGGYGAKAVDGTKYKNLRSQFYWTVAKKFEKGLYNLKHLPQKEFEILRGQLCAIKVKPADALGRFQIETKEDMLARQIKSPDFADCFMMLEYAYWMSRRAELKPMSYGSL